MSYAVFTQMLLNHIDPGVVESCLSASVATLLNQMHQLKTENARLEEHVRALKSHRDHLLSTNARLAVPFASGSGLMSEKSAIELTAHDKPQVLVL